MAKVRELTNRSRHVTLEALLRQLNPVLRLRLAAGYGMAAQTNTVSLKYTTEAYTRLRDARRSVR